LLLSFETPSGTVLETHAVFLAGIVLRDGISLDLWRRVDGVSGRL